MYIHKEDYKMKKVIFKNGTKAFFDDGSTTKELILIVSKFAEIDELANEFTKDNYNGGIFEDKTIENLIPLRIVAETNQNRIIARFVSREKTKDEILQEKIDELDKMLAKIKGQA